VSLPWLCLRLHEGPGESNYGSLGKSYALELFRNKR